MSMPYPMGEAWRGPVLENVHLGHAVVCDATGDIVQAWGDPNAVMLPRSSCKMIQALPLITSGAAGRLGCGRINWPWPVRRTMGRRSTRIVCRRG